jgi:hypothetical protein
LIAFLFSPKLTSWGTKPFLFWESLLRNRRTAQSGAYTKRRKARAKRLIGHKEIFSAAR